MALKNRELLWIKVWTLDSMIIERDVEAFRLLLYLETTGASPSRRVKEMSAELPRLEERDKWEWERNKLLQKLRR